MNGFSAIKRLSASGQSIVLNLVDNKAVKRLAQIRQLGFWSKTSTPRLSHTLNSIECAATLLDKIPGLSPSARDHVMSAIALEDVGRAPFSNSLDPVFPSYDRSVGETSQPIDVRRTIEVIRHLEANERILSTHGLDLEAVVELVSGNVPWQRARKLRTLLSSPLDVDRLTYIQGDIGAIDGVAYDIIDVVKSLSFDANDGTAIVDATSSGAIINILLERARLYMQAYYDPEKLGMEVVVRAFLRGFWRTVPDVSDLREPRVIHEFLEWNDDTVIRIFREAPPTPIEPELEHLRCLIRDGGLQVAEIREDRRKEVDINEIERRLATPKLSLAKSAWHWVLDNERLPSIQPLEPRTVLIRSGQAHRALEETPEAKSNPRLMQKLRRCPLIIFPTTEFSNIQKRLRDYGLHLADMVALESIKRSAAA